MNILVFTALWPNSEQPDFGIFVKHRIAALARLGQANVRVVAPVPYFPKSLARPFVPAHWQRAARVKEREVCDGLPVYHPRHLVTPKWGMRFYGRWMAEGAASLVRQLHAAQPIDLIDAHYVYPDGWAAARLGRALDVPVVITARGSDVSLFSQLPYIRPLLGEALRSAVGVIAVSGALRQHIIELGIEADKVAVIRNGIDRDLFHPFDREAARKKLGLEPEAKIILTVASLTANKGVDWLIDAMMMVARLQPRATLYVIGEGSERVSLETRIARCNLTGRVFLVGARPQMELAEWYSAADLFCLASQREGCPNVVIEAMACGTPVVATDVGGVSELITDPAYGCLIPSHQSTEGFAQRIDEALRYGWNRDEIAKHGGARSWDDVAVELMGYYAARGLIKSGVLSPQSAVKNGNPVSDSGLRTPDSGLL